MTFFNQNKIMGTQFQNNFGKIGHQLQQNDMVQQLLLH